jgi:hypothetical protein
MNYIRFITHDIDMDTGHEQGLLAAAYDVLREKGVTKYEEELIQGHIDWLKKHLPIPDKFSRTRNAYHKNTHGLSWLKPTAVEALNHLRAIAVILEEHGKPVTMLTTDKPGYIVYEDEWQLVAEPFNRE